MSQRPGRRRPLGRSGQATVETALALPVVLLALLAVVQVGVVVHHRLLVANAAREGARAAAVEPTPAAARAAAATAGLDPARLDVVLHSSSAGAPGAGGPAAPIGHSGAGTGDRVTVTVRYRSPTRVPIVGHLLPDIPLASAVTMRVE